MNYDNELRLCERVTALGNSADATALGELTGFTLSASARVRRLAASAIGKLAGIAPHPEAVEALLHRHSLTGGSLPDCTVPSRNGMQ